MGRRLLVVFMAIALAAGAGQAFAQGKSAEAPKKDAAAQKPEAAKAPEKTPEQKAAEKAEARHAKHEKRFADCMKNAKDEEAKAACKKKYDKAMKAQNEQKSQTQESKKKNP